MDPIEARTMLVAASARDPRMASIATPDVAAIWAEDLADVTVHEARDALGIFYREHPDSWLSPGHILRIVREGRRVRERETRVRRQIESRTESGPVLTGPYRSVKAALGIEDA